METEMIVACVIGTLGLIAVLIEGFAFFIGIALAILVLYVSINIIGVNAHIAFIITGIISFFIACSDEVVLFKSESKNEKTKFSFFMSGAFCALVYIFGVLL